MINVLRVVVFLWLGSASCLAFALPESCPHSDVWSWPLSREFAQEQERELAQLASRCQHDAEFLAWYGALLNQLDRPKEAADYLERALLLMPDMMGARIDYAESLVALGDKRAARALLREVLARDDVPLGIRSVLNARLREWGSLWSIRRQLTVRATHDSNLTGAPRAKRLMLTLPDFELPLLLAESYHRKRGVAILIDGSQDATYPLDSGQNLQVFTDVRTRQVVSISGLDYVQFDNAVAWQIPLTQGGQWALTASVGVLNYDGEFLYRTWRAAAQRDWEVGGCRPRMGLETEWREYPMTPELDGMTSSVIGGAFCQGGRAQGGVSVRMSYDTARDQQRAGRDQRRIEVRAYSSVALGVGVLEGSVSWSRQLDTHAYNPLFEYGARRVVSRWNGYVEYRHALSSHLYVLATLEGARQKSNLPLFDMNSQILSIGIRYYW